MKRQGISQRQGRHIEQCVAEQDNIERAEGGNRGHSEENEPASDVKHGQKFFGREVTVGNHANEKRGDQCRDACRPIRAANLLALKPESLG